MPVFEVSTPIVISAKISAHLEVLLIKLGIRSLFARFGALSDFLNDFVEVLVASNLQFVYMCNEESMYSWEVF